jgi:flagellar hook-associated protein 2
MITQIQLGNIFTQNDKTILSGGQSGLDIENLVKGLVEARRQPAVILESTLETNAKRSEAVSEMRTILDNFRDAADFLRNPPGVNNEADNIFEFRTGEVKSNSAVAGNNYMTITAEPGASTTDYEISISQLATRSIYTTNTFSATNADTAIVGAGLPLSAGSIFLGATNVEIELKDGDTLNQIAAKVNAAKDLSGVEAVAVKVADGQYRLSFKSIETGIPTEGTPPPPPGTNATITGSPFTGLGFFIQENAQNAIVEFDGTVIERQSNSINDIVEGVTFNLLNKTPVGTELEVEIKPDLELARQGILNFVDAYNEFRLFASRQSEIGSNGRPLETAVLAGSSTLTLTNARINAEMSTIVAGIVGDDPSRLSDIGIEFSDFPGDAETPFTRNILVLDESTLDAALQADFDAVRKVFEFDYTSDDPELQVFQRNNRLDVSEVDVNINQTTGVYTATYTDSLGVTQTINLAGEKITGSPGVILKGLQNTVLDGLTMIYGTNNNTSVNLRLSQGIGDRLYNTLDETLDDNTGVVGVALRNIERENERLQIDISRIDEQMERYREQLLDQYSALEAAINNANTILQTLDAQANAAQNN